MDKNKIKKNITRPIVHIVGLIGFCVLIYSVAALIWPAIALFSALSMLFIACFSFIVSIICVYKFIKGSKTQSSIDSKRMVSQPVQNKYEMAKNEDGNEELAQASYNNDQNDDPEVQGVPYPSTDEPSIAINQSSYVLEEEEDDNDVANDTPDDDLIDTVAQTEEEEYDQKRDEIPVTKGGPAEEAKEEKEFTLSVEKFNEFIQLEENFPKIADKETRYQTAYRMAVVGHVVMELIFSADTKNENDILKNKELIRLCRHAGLPLTATDSVNKVVSTAAIVTAMQWWEKLIASNMRPDQFPEEFNGAENTQKNIGKAYLEGMTLYKLDGKSADKIIRILKGLYYRMSSHFRKSTVPVQENLGFIEKFILPYLKSSSAVASFFKNYGFDLPEKCSDLMPNKHKTLVVAEIAYESKDENNNSASQQRILGLKPEGHGCKLDIQSAGQAIAHLISYINTRDKKQQLHAHHQKEHIIPEFAEALKRVARFLDKLYEKKTGKKSDVEKKQVKRILKNKQHGYTLAEAYLKKKFNYINTPNNKKSESKNDVKSGLGYDYDWVDMEKECAEDIKKLLKALDIMKDGATEKFAGHAVVLDKKSLTQKLPLELQKIRDEVQTKADEELNNEPEEIANPKNKEIIVLNDQKNGTLEIEKIKIESTTTKELTGIDTDIDIDIEKYMDIDYELSNDEYTTVTVATNKTNVEAQ